MSPEVVALGQYCQEAQLGCKAGWTLGSIWILDFHGTQAAAYARNTQRRLWEICCQENGTIISLKPPGVG